MSELIFLTDRYPYNNSEAFIENEIEILAAQFDKVYILPCGLMVDTSTIRNVPSNVVVLQPAASGDIFWTKPNIVDKIKWGIKNLLKWYVECLFSPLFYQEMKELIKAKNFTLGRGMLVFRTLAPAIRNSKHFRKLLKNEKISDVIFYEYWLEPTILFASQIVPKENIRKKICRTHGWDLYSERNVYNYLALQKKIVSEIDNLYFISQNGKEYLEKKYPEYADKYLLARLGTRDYGVGTLKKEDNIFLIVSCSRVVPLKRINRIIDALALLEEKYDNLPQIKWIHFGDGTEMKEIMKYAENKLGNKVLYQLPGNVANMELMRFYESTYVDLFINLSIEEGVPVSIMEATSFGIPIVATDVGGTSEIVYDGVNGTLVEKDFEDDLLVSILYEYIMNDKAYAEYRLQSRGIWERNYNNVENYTAFCNSITS